MDVIDSKHTGLEPPLRPPRAQTTFARVLWALDASTLETDRLEPAISAILTLAPQAHIAPAYVLDPEGLNWLGETPADRTDSLRPAAQAALENAVRETMLNAGHKRWIKPWIIEMSEVPIAGLDRRRARKLLSRADRFGADLILVQHRKRTGLRRWLKACFTEHLINDGELPILIVGPNTERVERIGEFVLATDFSPACRAVFEQTLRLAVALGVPIRIVHKFVPSLDPTIHGDALITGGTWVSLPGLSESLNDVFLQAGREWLQRADSLGVSAAFVTDDSGEGLAASIARICGEASRPYLVMAVPKGGRLPGSPWGSVTRDVLDEVPCPVLVLRG